jgi:hypothetical protein
LFVKGGNGVNPNTQEKKRNKFEKIIKTRKTRAIERRQV